MDINSSYKEVSTTCGCLRIAKIPTTWSITRDAADVHYLLLDPGLGKGVIRVGVDHIRTRVTDEDVLQYWRDVAPSHEDERGGLKVFRSSYPTDKDIAFAATTLAAGPLWRSSSSLSEREESTAIVAIASYHLFGGRIPTYVSARGLDMFMSSELVEGKRAFGSLWVFRNDSHEGVMITLPRRLGQSDTYTELDVWSIVCQLSDCVQWIP